MSWFGRSTGDSPASTISTVELDNKISEATSEEIPNGEIELAVAFEITDIIRGRKVNPKQAMRSLKKRLTFVYINPNLIISTLKLIDLCIKNCGAPFLVEISSKEFVDYLIDFIFKVHYNLKEVRDESKVKVGKAVLSYFQNWKIAFEGQSKLGYVEKKYQELKNEGYDFPSDFESNDQGTMLNSTFVDSEVPPDWTDSEECMICYTPFSMLNRKHHCRACGQVFCQTHSSNNMPLVNLGIMEPVRVCDNCAAKYDKSKKQNSRARTLGESHEARRGVTDEDDEEAQLRKAIELSLRESGGSSAPIVPSTDFQRPAAPPQAPQQQQSSSNNVDDEEDEELKAALAASLQEFESEKSRRQQYQQPPPQQQQQQPEPSQPELDLYNINYATGSNQYQQPQFTAPQQYSPAPEYPPAPLQQQQQQPQPPQQQYLQQQPPQQHTQQSPPPQVPQQQDLSPADEEQINLFITLMTNIKNDPKKQNNIMYDENLNELYGKVVQLKPKLNKSLRNSIERYEIFLEMNNKISTITRLYDQFLEQKLNMAYGNHTIGGQATGGQQDPYGYPSQPIQAQNTNGYYNAPQYGAAGYPSYPSYPPQQQQQPQQTGPSVSQQQTGVSQQQTGPPAQQSRPFQNYQPTGSEPPQQSRPFQNYQPTGNNAEPQQQSRPFQNYQPTGQMQPSEPDFGDDEVEEDIKQSVPQFKLTNEPPKQSTAPGSYPVYPTTDVLPATPNSGSDTEKNYVSVSLPHYPPPEDLSNELPPEQHFIRRASSALSANAYEEASMKYPTLENVEENYEKSQQEEQAGAQNLPNMPNMPKFGEEEAASGPRRQVQRKKSFVAEPEPLIEL
ncbi:Vacuolar protein sorting-associated protein 27 [Candida viswanathii]|uniref:Vacuolar protein sorting-associated protein 27 n=1 Tax=Candida viswanathii TaxID=5486 RepID=A0A367Y562_9ASCO|nr:Vacuolar protein sorting-associated protein 27 [Candida viswanathii]